MTNRTIAVLDFGSQYAQLLARRVRENHVHSTLFRPDITAEELRAMNAVGLILSGGPSSVNDENAPRCRMEVLEMGLPVLGICYGMQLACQMYGSPVQSAPSSEYGRTRIELLEGDPIFAHLPTTVSVWMSHGDRVESVSDDFVVLARTDGAACAAVRHRQRPFYGLQFHPEVTHTPHGNQIMRNFLYTVCGCRGEWQIGSVIDQSVRSISGRVGPDERVILGLSGGVDSSVAAALLHRAIGDRLVCIFVDNGLLRGGEVDLVVETFAEHFKMDLHVVDAADRFVDALDGVADPQEKRKIIGRIFIDVFKAEAEHIEGARYLAQGTLYPDVIESGHGYAGQTANIKLHHNVGGLPEELGFELIEPLRDLFKDEVRRMGEHLGLPEDIVWRHPFPGPGLAVRIIGPITRGGLETLRQVDAITLEEVHAAGWYPKIAQAFAVLIPVRTVGVMGDQRTYADQSVAVLRFVESTDFMTADWVRIDYEVLGRISTRIMNEVAGINRVVYDISSKPPATIEWE